MMHPNLNREWLEATERIAQLEAENAELRRERDEAQAGERVQADRADDNWEAYKHAEADRDRLAGVIETGAKAWLSLQVNHPIVWEGCLGNAMEAACDEIRRLAARCEELEGEVEDMHQALHEWMCFDCENRGKFKIVKRGSPIDGQDIDVVCERCGSDNTGEPSDRDMQDLIDRAETAEACVRELERDYAIRRLGWGAVPGATQEEDEQALQRLEAVLEAALARSEEEESDSNTCGECEGSGWFSPTPVRSDGWTCKVCSGTGVLRVGFGAKPEAVSEEESDA